MTNNDTRDENAKLIIEPSLTSYTFGYSLGIWFLLILIAICIFGLFYPPIYSGPSKEQIELDKNYRALYILSFLAYLLGLAIWSIKRYRTELQRIKKIKGTKCILKKSPAILGEHFRAKILLSESFPKTNSYVIRIQLQEAQPKERDEVDASFAATWETLHSASSEPDESGRSFLAINTYIPYDLPKSNNESAIWQIFVSNAHVRPPAAFQIPFIEGQPSETSLTVEQFNLSKATQRRKDFQLPDLLTIKSREYSFQKIGNSDLLLSSKSYFTRYPLISSLIYIFIFTVTTTIMCRLELNSFYNYVLLIGGILFNIGALICIFRTISARFKKDHVTLHENYCSFPLSKNSISYHRIQKTYHTINGGRTVSGGNKGILAKPFYDVRIQWDTEQGQRELDLVNGLRSEEDATALWDIVDHLISSRKGSIIS